MSNVVHCSAGFVFPSGFGFYGLAYVVYEVLRFLLVLKSSDLFLSHVEYYALIDQS